MAVLYCVVVLLACALSTYSAPTIEKRQADPVDAICAGLIAENASISYTVEISSDCTKFAQCLSEGGYTISNCSAGLLFDTTIGGCQYADRVPGCPIGPCSGQRDGAAVDDPRGCAHFFGCSFGVAVPLTCPQGESFSGNGCAPDPNCGYVEVTTIAMSPAELCLAKGKRAFPGDNTWYISVHAGGQEVEMPCAPGTTFDETCSCI